MPDGPPIYLDHAATTPLRPEARAAVLEWLDGRFGNPSGAHPVARAARRAVDEARDLTAEVLGCRPNEVVFTSGGTEADNLAVLGVHAARPGPVWCSAVEHEAVLAPVHQVGGATVPVDAAGRIELDALAEALRRAPDTTLVSVMAANNEIGVIEPIGDVVEVVRREAPHAAVHVDAVQAAPWLDVAALAAGADLISVSGHKLGGPQGVGALVVRRGTPLRAQALGGGQERELRSGTHNVAGIAGFAAALDAAARTREVTAARVTGLRDRLADGLLAAIPGTVETGVTGLAADAPGTGTGAAAARPTAGTGASPAAARPTAGTGAAGTGATATAGTGTGAAARAARLPGTVHVCLPQVESEALLFLLDEAGVCASAASACASGAQQASHVLAALGVPPGRAAGALRLTLGWTSTDADVDTALAVVPAAVARLRGEAA